MRWRFVAPREGAISVRCHYRHKQRIGTITSQGDLVIVHRLVPSDSVTHVDGEPLNMLFIGPGKANGKAPMFWQELPFDEKVFRAGTDHESLEFWCPQHDGAEQRLSAPVAVRAVGSAQRSVSCDIIERHSAPD